MYQHILIATDGSELAGRALTHGLALAKEVKASVTVVTVTQLWSAFDMAHKAQRGPQSQSDTTIRGNGGSLSEGHSRRRRAEGTDSWCRLQVVHVPDQHPAEGILVIVEKQGCDLIVMGSHGRRAVGRLLLGSQVNEVLAYSKVPILSCGDFARLRLNDDRRCWACPRPARAGTGALDRRRDDVTTVVLPRARALANAHAALAAFEAFEVALQRRRASRF